MDNKLSRYGRTLLLMSAILIATRYISASILACVLFENGVLKTEAFPEAMELLGPFLPVMSTVCLAGGVALLIVDAVLEYRRKNK